MNTCKNCRREVSWEDEKCAHCGCAERISDAGTSRGWLWSSFILGGITMEAFAVIAFVVVVVLAWLFKW